MRKAQTYMDLYEDGLTISDIAREYGVSRQCVSQALINCRKQKEERLGADDVLYPSIKEWLKNNHCKFTDFEKQCGCCLRHGLKHGKGMRKSAIDAILRVTGLTYEQAFAQ